MTYFCPILRVAGFSSHFVGGQVFPKMWDGWINTNLEIVVCGSFSAEELRDDRETVTTAPTFLLGRTQGLLKRGGGFW